MLQLVLSCLCAQAHAGMPKLFLGLVAPCVISHRVPHAATENVPHFPIGWGSGRDTVGKRWVSCPSSHKDSLKKQERTTGAVLRDSVAPKAVRNGETMAPSAKTEAWSPARYQRTVTN